MFTLWKSIWQSEIFSGQETFPTRAPTFLFFLFQISCPLHIHKHPFDRYTQIYVVYSDGPFPLKISIRFFFNVPTATSTKLNLHFSLLSPIFHCHGKYFFFENQIVGVDVYTRRFFFLCNVQVDKFRRLSNKYFSVILARELGVSFGDSWAMNLQWTSKRFNDYILFTKTSHVYWLQTIEVTNS